MKKIYAVPCLLLCILVALCSSSLAGEEQPVNLNELVGDPLERLPGLTHIGTDEKFSAMLLALNQDVNIYAPLRMRTFMAHFTAARLKMSTGYSSDKGRAVLVWVVEEMVVPGYREQVMQRLQAAAKALGLRLYSGADAGSKQMIFRTEADGVAQTMSISRPQQHYAGGRPYVVLSFVWRIDDSCLSALPTLTSLITGLPYLKDRRIADAFYQELGELEVEFLSRGGEKYGAYDWNVTFVKGLEMEEDVIYTVVRGALDNGGYVPGATEKGVECYSLPGRTTRAFLKPVDEVQKIRLFIVPETR